MCSESVLLLCVKHWHDRKERRSDQTGTNEQGCNGRSVGISLHGTCWHQWAKCLWFATTGWFSNCSQFESEVSGIYFSDIVFFELLNGLLLRHQVPVPRLAKTSEWFHVCKLYECCKIRRFSEFEVWTSGRVDFKWWNSSEKRGRSFSRDLEVDGRAWS